VIGQNDVTHPPKLHH